VFKTIKNLLFQGKVLQNSQTTSAVSPPPQKGGGGAGGHSLRFRAVSGSMTLPRFCWRWHNVEGILSWEKTKLLGILALVIWSMFGVTACYFRSTAAGMRGPQPHRSPPAGPGVSHSSFNSQMEARAVGHFLYAVIG
jgi:hypothetical protein